MYLLGNRGDLEGAVLRNSWFTQLFVTIKNGVPQGAYVDIFDEMQARDSILRQMYQDIAIDPSWGRSLFKLSRTERKLITV